MSERISEKFSQAVVSTLAKRAATRCSNPDCGAITSGPADEPARSVNIGEAAHIYGARAGSARFRIDMSLTDRSSITNGIWLCSNCHKLVDDDPTKYPAGLLFEWQRDHELRVSRLVGKAGADLRERYNQRHLEEFGRLSYLSERIVLEKGEHWEYRLTGEVLRFEMASVIARWAALRSGLYMRPAQIVPGLDYFSWFRARNLEMLSLLKAFSGLTNNELARSWGKPGSPGDEMLIVRTCRLFRELCESALQWEEMVRFTKFDEAFDEAHGLCVGIAGRLIDEVEKIPIFISGIFEENPEGFHTLSLVLALPDGWSDSFEEALKRAKSLLKFR